MTDDIVRPVEAASFKPIDKHRNGTVMLCPRNAVAFTLTLNEPTLEVERHPISTLGLADQFRCFAQNHPIHRARPDIVKIPDIIRVPDRTFGKDRSVAWRIGSVVARILEIAFIEVLPHAAIRQLSKMEGRLNSPEVSFTSIRIMWVYTKVQNGGNSKSNEYDRR